MKEQKFFTDNNDIILNNIRIHSSVKIDCPENLTLENDIYIAPFCYIEASKGIIIQEGCQIASHSVLTTHSSHISIRLYGKEYKNLTPAVKMEGYKTGSILIGKFTFIGAHTLINYGTKIGKGSLIKAYSNVKGIFEDFSIIEGNPAKKIGDTREIDKKYLKDNNQLIKIYTQWANQ